MRYQLREKLWTLGETFAIKDRDGNDVFQVKGRVFSIGNKLSFQDLIDLVHHDEQHRS